MKKWHFALIVFLGGCSYGILSTFVKLGYAAGFSVTEITAGQYLFGVSMIWFLVLFSKKRRISGNLALKLLLSGIPFGLTSMFYYQSLQTLHASLAIVFLFQFVWIGSLLEWIAYKTKPSKEKLVSIFMLLIGSVLAAGVLSANGMTITWQGAGWGMLAAFSFTFSIFLSGSVGKGTPPLLKSALLSTGGLIVVFIILPPAFIFDPPVLTSLAVYGLALGFFGTLLPPLLFSIGMPQVGPGLGTILSASELPTAVFMSSVVLMENVGGWQWAGVVLILSGIVIGNSNFQKSKPKDMTKTYKENTG